MAKLRTCKICGKQYEYCNHCPSKNVIEPWRNLYCSENCRDSFIVMGDYAVGKIDAVTAKTKLEGYGITATKVREIHKGVVADIFRAAKPEVVTETIPAVATTTLELNIGEIPVVNAQDIRVVSEPNIGKTETVFVQYSDNKPKVNFKKKNRNKNVNEDSN